jgi:hypothetical protein
MRNRDKSNTEENNKMARITTCFSIITLHSVSIQPNNTDWWIGIKTRPNHFLSIGKEIYLTGKDKCRLK